MLEIVLDDAGSGAEEKEDGSKWYKGYYERNKEKISERRKAKYREDGEFRQEMLESSRAYRQKKQIEREKKAARRGVEYVRRRGGPRKPVEIPVSGGVELGYTISTLQKKSKRSMATIRSWRTKGLFPVTPFQTKRGDSLYTMKMIGVLCSVLRSYARMTTDSAFKETVETRWQNLRIPVGEKIVVSR